MRSTIIVDKAFRKAQVDERLFSSFIEHLGRAVYGGIYEPGHPDAEEHGFRRDVLALVRELDVPLIRYPGGNFVSAYSWEDSVGPVEKRPRRLELAWRSIETNAFGLHEWMTWARDSGADTMMALNLGTRGIQAARDLVEYCNHPGGSYWSDLRRANGAAEPFAIKTWCLGNEMDGPWQIGHKTADEYGRLASEVSRALRLFDPTLQLVVCGSSNDHMPTFPQWEATVLEHCYHSVDYLSMHSYYHNQEDDLETFLASNLGMEAHIRSVVNACDFAKAKARSNKTINISFDEWNVWFHSREQDRTVSPWTVGPALLEDVYTFEDALVVGGLLNTLLRNADRVKIACIAQLVNVIAPIMTRTGGGAWRQTIFWPLLFVSRYGRGTVLDARVEGESYENQRYGPVPYLDAAAVWHEDSGELDLFVLNRSRLEPVECSTLLAGYGPGWRAVEQIVLHHDDLKAANTEEWPDTVIPVHLSILPDAIEGERFSFSVGPLSWNLFRLMRTEQSQNDTLLH